MSTLRGTNLRSLAQMVCVLLFLVASLSACASRSDKSSEDKVNDSAAELREILKSTVKDADRLQQMLVLANQFEADMKAGTAEIAKISKEQGRLNADYNASRDDFRQLGELIQAARTEYRTKQISTRNALAQLATDYEWKKITFSDHAILVK